MVNEITRATEHYGLPARNIQMQKYKPMRKGTVGLTPKGHLPPVEHHSHDLHRQVSNLSSADPPAVPLFQIYELDPV